MAIAVYVRVSTEEQRERQSIARKVIYESAPAVNPEF